MVIIIDGYNFLRSIFDHHKGSLEKERTALIKKLGVYFEQKAATVNEILLVFDGGRSVHVEREVKKKVVIYFSGTRSNADEVIVQQVEKRKSKELLLVTHDRGLIGRVQKINMHSVVMDAESFWAVMHQAFVGQKKNEVSYANQWIKYAQKEQDPFFDFPQEENELDYLMEVSLLSHQNNKKELADNDDGKSKALKRKNSKNEKIVEKVIKKL